MIVTNACTHGLYRVELLREPRAVGRAVRLAVLGRRRDRLKAGVEAGAVDGILAAAGRGELLLILGEVPVRAAAVARAGVVAAVLLPLAGLGDLGDGLFDFGALVVTGVRFFSFYT
jgi:hypothetical protein